MIEQANMEWTGPVELSPRKTESAAFVCNSAV